MRVLACLLIVGLIGAAPRTSGAGVGSVAPTLSLTTVDGSRFGPAHTAGAVTVVNFWATWCPPCRAETPDLIAAYARLHQRGVAFVGIDTTETAPIVKTFLSAKGVPYPTALAGPALYNAYDIAYIPTTIVLDAAGVVRARWVGGLKPAQLAQYVSDARAGRNSTYVSAAQAKIDGLLARAATAAGKSDAAVAEVDAAIARADAVAKRSGSSVDYERTQREEGALLIAAGTRLRNEARTTPQKIAGLGSIARGSGKLNRWNDAVHADRAALALTPDAPQLVAALARDYYRLHDYAAMIAQAQRYTRLAPADGEGWSDLGLAYQRARMFAFARPAYERGLKLLRAQALAKPSQDTLANVADTALDAANVDVSLGDAAGAKRYFDLANAYGDRLAAHGDYATLKGNVKERTQEGLVAVALAGGSRKTVVSVAPWTGPDLPGSLASTLKYRLVVAAPADSTVTLRARGLRRDWVASFCADGLCSPQSVSFQSPPGGVKTYEFQLVPPHDGDVPGSVAIAAGNGSTVIVPPAGRQQLRR